MVSKILDDTRKTLICFGGRWRNALSSWREFLLHGLELQWELLQPLCHYEESSPDTEMYMEEVETRDEERALLH